nr:adenylyltransferase/cytidyltransferase family protein [uncultured Schaedlerella sp.]
MVKKEIVLFGTGKYFENYMLCEGMGLGRAPVFAVDNDPSLTETIRYGVEVKSPEVLQRMDREQFYVVICTAQRESVEKQLESMGITDYHYYRPVPIEDKIPPKMFLSEKRKELSKPYRIGYVPGAFDLFHVGHLNLLRRSKSRCEYLIAGVLTDELYEHFKKKKPVIPYEQRAAIVSAISYVDRVVPVDFSNTYKIDAWKRYHYDCHFSGNDHGSEWERDLEQLRVVGADMEFFEYTKANSSTAIRENL